MKILIGYGGCAAADEALKDLARAGLPSAAQVRLLLAFHPENHHVQ